ncbi:MAG: sugar ABC transporter permease [Proteobacteria bacterium]|nr:sugar ABC transporter permease [Pseudomonadota bacterium]
MSVASQQAARLRRPRGDSWGAAIDRAAGFLLSTPALAVLVGLMLYPLLYAIWLSFVQWRPAASAWIGLANYERLFADRIFWIGLGNTVFYTAWNVSAGTTLSLSLALLMNRPTMAARFLRLAIFMPAIISAPVAAMAWLWVFDSDYGLLNQTLASLGLFETPVPWLNSPFHARWSIVIVNIWLGTGLSSILFLAGLQDIPKELHESAMLDGANAWQRFWAITFPLIRPTLLVVLVIKLIGSFKTFDQIFIMTGGGPLYRSETILIYLYRQGFEYFDFGFAAAVGVVFFMIVAALSLAQSLLLGRSPK